MVKKNLKKKILFTSLLGGSLCAILLIQINPSEIFYGLKNIIPLFLLVYIILNIVVYLLRSWRFKILIGNRVSVRELFSIVSLHTMFINLFPFGAGELTYPYFLKKRNITSGIAQGIPSLFLARIFDIIFVGIFLILSLLSIKKGTDGLLWIGAVIAAGFLLLVFLNICAKKKEAVISFLESKSHLERFNKYPIFLQKIITMVDEILKGFEVLANRKILLFTLLLTVGCRFVMYIGVFYLFKGVRLPLEFTEVVLISSIYIFLPILPVNTFAGIGTTEALLVMMIMFFGYSKETSVIASFQIHILQLLIAVVLGLFALLDFSIKNRNSKALVDIT